MRNIKVAFLLLSFLLHKNSVFAQENGFDGPYLIYQNDKLIEKSLVGDSLQLDTLDIKRPFYDSFFVKFTDHPQWGFTFSLHPINIPSAVYLTKPDSLVILSDIEGEFGLFREMLIGNHIIDEKYRWVYGKGALIIAGDLFDRGNEVLACMWLLYKLEEEARQRGGAVHVILGNHEVMNLSGDTRYVQPKYFYTANVMKTGYNRLFDRNTELGRWLRTKNVIEKIGDILVAHGGISPELVRRNIPLDSINFLVRPWIDRAASDEQPEQLEYLLGAQSPYWYRGYFLDPRANDTLIDATLNRYQCSRIVVGHTVLEKITPCFNGKVIGIDVDYHRGNAQGLLVQGKDYFIIDKEGRKSTLQQL